MTIAPGPEESHVIIINFSDNAKVKIENSNVYTYPQPTLTNISYLLSDDEAEVTIINSYLNCKLPAILHMNISLTPPTAGTFILTGNTIWTIYNTKIECFLRINDDMLIGRWFLFTLQGNAQLYMKDCFGYMNESSQPFIKPVAGYVKLEDCNIVYGVIDVEVVAEFEAINLTIEKLNLRDQTNSKLIRCKIANDIDVGSVAIVPSAAGSISFDDSPKDLPKSYFYAEDTVIGQKLIAQGNSTNELVNCEIGSCTIFSEGSVVLERSEVDAVVEVKEDSSLKIDNSSVFTINVGENGKVTIFQNSTVHAINKLTTGFNCKSDIELHSTTINLIDIFGGDQLLPPYEPGYDPDINISKINIKMYDSTIKELKTEDDAEIYLTIKNSEITEFKFKQVRSEPVKITILDLGGTYNIPDPWPDLDLEFLIYHQLSIKTLVNNKPVKSKILIDNQLGKNILSTFTTEQGSIFIDLLYESIKDNITTFANSYEVQTSYLGFFKVFNTSVGINEEYNISWIDRKSPVISSISIDTRFHSTKRPTRIRAIIIDFDVKAIANATIYYKVDLGDGSGWSNWLAAPMLEVENNTFEGEIEDLPDGTKVKFYIEANDILGNRIVSKQKSYSIENPNLMVSMSGLLFLIIMIILILSYYLKRRSKVNYYIHKRSNYEPRVQHENSK